MVAGAMNRLVCILLTLALAGPLAAAKKTSYELRGKIEPPPGPAVVVLSSANHTLPRPHCGGLERGVQV